jgi:hypothetical protein
VSIVGLSGTGQRNANEEASNKPSRNETEL